MTQSDSERSARREAKLVGAFLFLLGLFGFLFGLSILFLGTSPLTTGLSCRAICGLAMLASEFLGPFAATVLNGTFFAVVGLAFLCVGHAVYKGRYCFGPVMFELFTATCWGGVPR